jgi:general L-amino acid transport system permease protein
MSSTVAPKLPSKRRDWSWRSQAFRGLVYQVVAIGLIAFAIWFLAHNTLENMRVRGIQSGFGFLGSPAGFDIGEGLLSYDALDPYWKAFLQGVFNTLRVAIVGIIMTTILGTLLGIGRFSHNALLRGICYGYVELFRNVPVLLQLLMWYLLFTEVLPDPFDPFKVFNLFFLSKGGVTFPTPTWGLGWGLAMVGALVGLGLAFAYRRWAWYRFELTGQVRSLVWVPIVIVFACMVLGWVLGGAPTAWDVPKHTDGPVEGGGNVSPEFMAVLLGLVFYTASFVAEVVRAGIASVAHGQSEAAGSLGLSRNQMMRLVVLPQALRVIIPPMTNQYLNLTKNSSLAVAIGYPDVVSISNTAINQTGRAVECIAIIMLVYLATSLTTSFFMNWYNKKASLKER